MKAIKPVKCLMVLLAMVLFHGQAFAGQAEAEEIAKVRENAKSLGIGKNVILKLRSDNSEIKGRILRLEEDGLAVTEKSSGRELSGTYAELKSIRQDGPPILKWVAMGGAAVAGIILWSFAHELSCNEKRC